MYYDFTLTVPAGTTENSPVEVKLPLTHGIIHRVEVEFYPGPRRYVSVRIYHLEHQIWPTNPQGAFKTDGYTIGFDEYYELEGPPYTLTARGFAPEADYDHVVTIRIGLLSNKASLFLLNALEVIIKIGNLLGIRA